jgi:trimeric autotransporter adhesin
MATYTHNATAVPSGIAWYNVEIGASGPVGSPTSTLIVFANSDGTETRVIGTGFTFSGSTPTGGTVTELDRTSSGGATVYETVTSITGVTLVALLTTPDEGNRSAFRLIFNAADTFNGFSGDDFFIGGAGGDSFTGGAGIDTVSYDNALTAVRADLGTPATNTNDAAGDTYSSIENLIGSDFNDTLIGNSQVNVLKGGLGNDFMFGGAGNDSLDGGAGIDTASYSSANVTAAITVIMAATSTVTGNSTVGTDVLTNVEGIRGTSFGDSMTAATNFSGSNGTFVDFEGMGGDDTFSGNGNTRISYTQALAGVTVDLLAGTAHSTAALDAAAVGNDSFAGTIGPDHINAVNAVRGSDFADSITAAGARGFFQFIGFKGNDTFTGTAEAINNFDNNLARYDLVSSAAGTVNNGINAVLDTTSTVTDIAGGNAVGTDTLIGIERIRGSSVADTFTANAGFSGQYGTANWFEGMGGSDTITGNGHTHIQYGNALAAVTVNLATGVGQSTAAGDAAGVGVDNIVGGVNSVTGSNFNDTLVGSNGAQAETFVGEAGNDNIDGGGGLLDRVSYRSDMAGVTVNLGGHTATDGFGGTDTLNNIEGVVGSEFNDVITGDGNVNRLQGQNGNDQLFGGGSDDFLVGDDGVELYNNAFGTGGTPFDSGNDTLDGGSGADQMWGGKGNDTYFVDNAGDVVIENANEGNDTVNASISYTLSAEVENLTMQGGADLQGYGNALVNTITGNSGNNLIDGGAGGDTMIGGAGGDTYFVDNSADSVVENAAEGNDTVFTTAIITLSANVENLIMQGSADLQGYGNADANVLYGNTGNNLLNGNGGVDLMVGGAGNDIYFVDDSSDSAFEVASEGNDTVFTSASYGLAAEVENLIMTGSADLQGYGSAQANVLYGNAGNNLLNGSGGVDLMVGGAGNDTYFVDDPSDSAFEVAGEGNDAVFASCNYGLAAEVETLVMQGSGNFQGYGSTGVNTLYGNAGNNLLNGAGGADTMIGGAGDDTYFVDDVGDVVFENASEGTDAVFASVNYTLTANVETLVLQGATDLTGTGNGGANTIVGNDGNNVLDGGASSDVLIGNPGNDTFVFHMGEASGDTVFDFAGNGAATGDSLQFVGYGPGATFTNIDATHWQVNFNSGSQHEVITFSNGASIDATDFLFS